MIQQFSRLALTSQDLLFSQLGDSELPSQFHDSPQIEKLDCMMIQNFKSFDKKYVGPFLNFTSIIGPNGSGKSNILDALMFCFCSQSSRHSLLDARELINRQGKQTFKELSKLNKVCSVEATFKLKNGEKFVIARTLDAEGKEQYLLNFKNVSKRIYQNVLLRKGINCNTPNYAIWQGEIDRLILRDPSQLTSLLQNLSGSIYFKKSYDEIRDKLKQLQSIIEQKTRRINKLKLDRKNLKSLKQTSEQYSKYDAQYQEVMKKIYCLQVLEKERAIEELAEEVKAVAEEEKKKIGEINQLKANAQRDYSRRLEIQEEMNKVMGVLAEHYAQLKNVGNPANVLKLQKLKQAESYLSSKQKQVDFMKTRRTNLAQSIPEIPSTALMDEYLSLYQQWQSENTALHRQISKKKNELLFIEGILQSKSDLLQEFEEKKRKINERKQGKKKNMESLKEDLKVLTESVKQMEAESAKVADLAEKNRQEYEKKKKGYEEICFAIDELQHMISEQAQDQKEADMLKNLASIDGFYGALHQKIKPGSSKYDVCFTLMLGNMGKYLLCQSEECSRRIGNRLKQIRLMKNVIILDNVVERRSNDIRKALGKDAVMGIDVVDFDQDTKGLKQYLSQMLHGKVVCDTVSTAYRIRNKNIEGVREIYTLDGNVIRKDGVISTHGNPEMLKKTHKFSNNKTSIYNELSSLAKQKIKSETELHNLKLKFDQKQIIKRNFELDQLKSKKQATLSRLKQLENQEDKEPTIPQSVVIQIQQLQRQRDKIEKMVGQLEKMIRNSKIFEKFMKKHGVDSLEAFRNANNFEHVEGLMRKRNEINKEIGAIEAEIQKMEREMTRKRTEVQQLREEVESIPELGDKGKIEKQISEQQKQLVQLRNKLSKLTNITRTQASFHSALPNLQAKLLYTKQKLIKQLQDLSYELGVQHKYPIPYSQLAEELNLPKKVTEKTLENLHEKLEHERTKIEEQLDKHNSINLLTNVREDEEKIQKGMNGLLEEIDQAIKERKKATEELEQVRKDRAQVLVGFVNLLKQHLGSAYKILTEQQDGSTGTINLHLQNEDEPFEHGIYFTPTPPTKRFVYDLEQLSGGQRSIASLALQYSIALASKSPILVLDETDAFLDVGNVNRLIKLINSSLREHRVQIVLVTHKQGLFSKSQSLVGVSRPKSLNLSQVYSLKLDN